MGAPLTFFPLHPTQDVVMEAPDFKSGEVLRARAWFSYPGGKALNAARVAGRLGGDARALVAAPAVWRSRLRAFLAPDRVRWTLLPVVGEGRVCLVLREHGRETVINTTLAMTFTRRHWLVLAGAVRRAAARSGFTVFAGSLPPSLSARQLRTLLALAARGPGRLALDQTGSRLREGLRHRPWIIKPNLAEFRALTATRARTVAELAVAAQGVRRSGAGRVLLSLGSRGCLLVGPAGTWFAPPLPVHGAAPSPIGCGDALFGAFLAAVAAGDAEPDALRAGVAAATANLFHPGACLFEAREVRARVARVEVKRVAA